MLDLYISYNPSTGTLVYKAYDKRQCPKLVLTPLTKFPSAYSLTSAHMSLNIVTSQAHRFYRICRFWYDFAESIAGTLYELYRAGHEFKALHSKLCLFLRTHAPLYCDKYGRDNRVIHSRIFYHFNQALQHGLPLLEGRNRLYNFPTRQVVLSPVYWPPNPHVHKFPTP